MKDGGAKRKGSKLFPGFNELGEKYHHPVRHKQSLGLRADGVWRSGSAWGGRSGSYLAFSLTLLLIPHHHVALFSSISLSVA